MINIYNMYLHYIVTNMTYGITIATKYIQWNLTKKTNLRTVSGAAIFI